MKTFLLFAISLILISQAESQVNQQIQITSLERNVAEKMIDNYNGFFRGHGQTSGVIIPAAVWAEITAKFPNQDVALMFARTLGKDPDIESETKKTRPTIIIKVLKKGTSSSSSAQAEYEYYDLTSISNLCPEPEGCNITSRN